MNEHARSGRIEDLLALDEDALAARTVGLDYGGTRESLLPLLHPDLPDSAPVCWARCPDYQDSTVRDAVARTFAALDVDSVLHNARRIVVKIGLIEGRAPEEHVTPHPAVLEALVRQLRSAAAADAMLCVADGPGHERDTEHVLARTGVGAVLAGLGVPFVDLNVDDVAEVPVPQPAAFESLVLPRTILDADLVVSLAKLKTHHRAGVTLGMKNLFGCVPGSIYGFPKTRLHYAGTARVIADLVSVIVPGLTLIDAVTAMEGTGPLDGQPRSLGTILAGRNVATTDAAATRMMGFAPLLIPQFWYALGKGLLRYPVLVGDPPPEGEVFEPPDNITWLRGTAHLPEDQQLDLLSRLLDSARPAGARH
jgi:uncharacterized protein (DUF362 family)